MFNANWKMLRPPSAAFCALSLSVPPATPSSLSRSPSIGSGCRGALTSWLKIVQCYAARNVYANRLFQGFSSDVAMFILPSSPLVPLFWSSAKMQSLFHWRELRRVRTGFARGYVCADFAVSSRRFFRNIINKIFVLPLVFISNVLNSRHHEF